MMSKDDQDRPLAQTFDGTSGNDTIGGTDAADTINGLGGDDLLGGFGGADVLNGGDGNDVLQGGLGDDQLNGGDGFDIASYLDIGAGVTVDLGLAVQPAGAGGADRLVSIEGLIGSDHADRLTGDAGNNFFDGAGGADLLSGGAGDDLFQLFTQTDIVAGERYSGGDGTDTVRVLGAVTDISAVVIDSDVEELVADATLRVAASHLNGRTWVEAPSLLVVTAGTMDMAGAVVRVPQIYLTGGLLDLSAVAGSTVDIISGGSTAEIVRLGTRAASVATYDGDDEIHGSTQGDILDGGGGFDRLFGGGGDDVLRLGAEADHAEGGDGTDRFFSSAANAALAGLVVRGGAGIDRLEKEAGGTSDYGNLSTAVIDSIEEIKAPGAITLTAAQLDYLSVLEVTGQVTISTAGVVDLTDSTRMAQSFRLGVAGIDLRLPTLAPNAGIRVEGSAGSDRIVAGGSLEILLGEGGDDVLIAGVGVDHLRGGAGNDVLEGDGDDIAEFSGHREQYAILWLGDGWQAIEGPDGTDRFRGMAALDFMGDSWAPITLGPGAVHDGRPTAETVSGTVHADQLRGAGGDDSIEGLGASDILYGGEGNDRLLGGEGDDYLSGDAGDDILDGGASGQDGDVANGGAGSDRIINVREAMGGAGDDHYFDIENINGSSDDGVDTVYWSGASYELGQETENIRFSWSAEDSPFGAGGSDGDHTARGNDLGNLMVGAAGIDRLYGEGEDDHLRGLEGADILWGGWGADILEGDAVFRACSRLRAKSREPTSPMPIS